MTETEAKKATLGRNPTIDRQAIEDAVRKVAKSHPISLNKVAAELGVNVTTVYRHTGGLEALRRIHALQSFELIGDSPSPAGETWRSWLMQLAGFYRDAFLQSPDLLKYAQAGLDPKFQRLENATRVLIDYGFTPKEAVRAHAFLINNVVGYVHQELQTKQQELAGSTPVYTMLIDALQNDAEHLPILNELKLDAQDTDSDKNFTFFIGYALDGIGTHLGQ